jgi:tetratricopeptide (TPR) repeat protein
MSLRFRKSMKLMPGVRLNFNKDSIGMSFGVPGARYTINSKGRRTVTTGLPGTGIYNVETLSSGSRSANTRSAALDLTNTPKPKPMSPTFFSKKAEKEFYKFILDIYNEAEKDSPAEIITKADALKAKFPTLHYPLDLLKFLHGITVEGNEELINALGPELWKNRALAFNGPISEKYFPCIKPQVQITKGISTNDIYNAQNLGHIWVEALQDQQRYTEALEVLHQMIPNQLVAISIADIELEQKQFDAAIETTEDIENYDDATAMMLILRGIAFREKGLNDAALECLKRALSQKDRSEGLLHRALFERAEIYVRLGKKAMAIKDLENILVDDSIYPQVTEKLDKLNS